MRLIVFPDREGAAANLQVDDYAKLILVIQGPDREAKGVSRSMIHCPNCRSGGVISHWPTCENYGILLHKVQRSKR